eukprot:2796653-Prymnesium_polylepis.1
MELPRGIVKADNPMVAERGDLRLQHAKKKYYKKVEPQRVGRLTRVECRVIARGQATTPGRLHQVVAADCLRTTSHTSTQTQQERDRQSQHARSSRSSGT